MKVVFLGAGNVAFHLAQAMADKGIQIVQIYSRTQESAKTLADHIGCTWITELHNLDKSADVYILSVKDDTVAELAGNLSFSDNKIVVHTAGSVPMDVLAGASEHTGVFYPLQSFSKSRKMDYKTIPFLLEASNENTLMLLENLARSISNSVNRADSEQRKYIHVSAVIAANFSNYMYSIAEGLLESKQIPFDVLKPIIMETAQKAMEMSPTEVQTGPARRNDLQVLERHKELLKNNLEALDVYKLLSQKIVSKYN